MNNNTTEPNEVTTPNEETNEKLITTLETLDEKLENLGAGEGEVVEVDGVEMNEVQILSEIYNLVRPNEEELELQQQTLQVQTEQETQYMSNIENSLNELIRIQTETLVMIEENHNESLETSVEGFFFTGLAFIIGMAVYMFWNQLSKW